MKIYALIGYPLGHSFSAKYFNDRFATSGERAVYVNLPIADVDELPAFLACNPMLCGFNVTIPYKEKIMPLLDEISEDASEVGAVNVVKVIHGADGRVKLKGYNSDVYGFDRLLKATYGERPLPQGALVLGTGGASKAVRHALRKRNIKVQSVSRDPKGSECIGYDSITADLLAEYPLIVNTTPVGMYPKVDAMPPVPVDLIGERNVVIDVIYNPEPTRLMEECGRRGALVAGGMTMLIAQAEEAYRIWGAPKGRYET